MTRTRLKMSFQDIPQFPQAHYAVDVGWTYLEEWLRTQDRELELNPEYQREHVWTGPQKTAYVEYILRGGETSRVLYWNHPTWMSGFGEHDKLELVDGKQRLTAVREFLAGEVPAFGRRFGEFTGKLRWTGPSFKMQVASLKTRADVLQWYLGINAGGTPHSAAELARVRGLLARAEHVDKLLAEKKSPALKG